MANRMKEVLDTFPGDKTGEARAWGATEKYAGILVAHEAVDRLAIGVRQLRNEIGQWEWAVVVVFRES